MAGGKGQKEEGIGVSVQLHPPPPEPLPSPFPGHLSIRFQEKQAQHCRPGLGKREPAEVLSWWPWAEDGGTRQEVLSPILGWDQRATIVYCALLCA